MKIYFGGSITGGRDDSALYSELITILKKHGQVLTEHIGDPKLSVLGDGVKMSAADIFNRDVAWLKDADVVVAEVSTPSLGVGYELGVAEAEGKKVLCLYREREGKRISAMITGNSALTTQMYGTLAEAESIISKFFMSIDQ